MELTGQERLDETGARTEVSCGVYPSHRRGPLRAALSPQHEGLREGEGRLLEVFPGECADIDGRSVGCAGGLHAHGEFVPGAAVCDVRSEY